MKPAPFEYYRVDTAEDAVERLGQLGEDAKVLAGGQSLVPMMNFRLARPSALIDVTRATELRYVRREGESLRVGALARHADLEHAGETLSGGYEVFGRVARLVGHFPIRARGTFGGSIAHSDPSAEWCMLCAALDPVMVVLGAGGRREIAASDFFLGFFTNALDPAEVITEVRFEAPWRRTAIQEFARRRGDFAIVAAIVALNFAGDNCTDARVVVGGVGEIPVRVSDAERALEGSAPTPEALAEAAAAAAAEVDPNSDVHASASHRRHLTEVLVRRALQEAVERDDR